MPHSWCLDLCNRGSKRVQGPTWRETKKKAWQVLEPLKGQSLGNKVREDTTAVKELLSSYSLYIRGCTKLGTCPCAYWLFTYVCLGCVFQIICQYMIWSFHHWDTFYILDTIPLSNMCFANILPVCVLPINIFLINRCSNWSETHFLFFFLLDLVLSRICLRNLCLH